MRKLRLSKYERVAGLFILVAIIGSGLIALSAAVKQGWFEPRFHYSAIFESADGVRAGSSVRMAGLNAGAIDDVELLPDNRIRVDFHVLGKFRERVRQDSKVLLIRPFILGDRVLEVTVGGEKQPLLAEKSELATEETLDIMTLMSGKKMGSVFSRMGHVMENLQVVAEAFADKNRMGAVVRMFDRMEPMIANLDAMSVEVIKLSKQATRDDNLRKTLANTSVLTGELNEILPELNKANPELGQDLALLTRSLGKMTVEMEAALSEVGPEGRSSAKRAVEALNEATVLMKALQKSFFLRSSVREVHEEEAKDRLPASDKSR